MVEVIKFPDLKRLERERLRKEKEERELKEWEAEQERRHRRDAKRPGVIITLS